MINCLTSIVTLSVKDMFSLGKIINKLFFEILGEHEKRERESTLKTGNKTGKKMFVKSLCPDRWYLQREGDQKARVLQVGSSRCYPAVAECRVRSTLGNKVC